MSEAIDERRRQIVERRRSLSPEEVELRSAALVIHLELWLKKQMPDSAVVGLYQPSRPNRDGEIDPTALVHLKDFSGVHFAFPRVLDRFQFKMDFAIPAHESDWVRGVFGNREPRHELLAVPPHEIDILIVPGVLFGKNGERVGRGGGYYDRYLAGARGALRIGVGYDFQLSDTPIPQEVWDARVDVVITDRRTVETSARPPL